MTLGIIYELFCGCSLDKTERGSDGARRSSRIDDCVARISVGRVWLDHILKHALSRYIDLNPFQNKHGIGFTSEKTNSDYLAEMNSPCHSLSTTP